jgi:hypothetical protein
LFPEAIVNFGTSRRRLKVLAGVIVLGSFTLTAVQVSHSHAAPHWRERRAFVATLQTEMRRFENSLKSEMNELKASQKARRDQSEREARDQRRACFKQATRGSEKRTCVQTLLARRKDLVQRLKEEMKLKREDHRARRKQMEEEQRRRLAEFDHRGAASVPGATAVADPTPAAVPTTAAPAITHSTD